MKIKIKRLFSFQVDAVKVKTFQPGIYEVGKDISREIASAALKFGKVEVVLEKKAPENKVVKAPENKSKVAKKSGYRRSTRTISDE